MALTDKLTAIADAIRAKTGGTDALSLDGMVTAIGGIEVGGGESSGGTSAVYSGSFTPAENVLTVTIDVGGSYTHFVCYAVGTVTGHSVKATAGFIADFEAPCLWGMSTSNNGASLNVIPHQATIAENVANKYFTTNNTQIRYNRDNTCTIDTSIASGACLGYFIAGVTYKWYAW